MTPDTHKTTAGWCHTLKASAFLRLAATALIAGFAGTACDLRPESVEPLDAVSHVSGWVPYWTRAELITRAAVTAGFTDLLFFHGTVDQHGGVSLENPDNLGQAVQIAEQAGVRPWLTVTNHGKSLAGALGPGRLPAHAERLLQAFKASRCRHLDLDYESMTPDQALQLPELARLLDARLDDAVRLSFTLQPVDTEHRRELLPMVRQLLAMPRVATVRFMMYDYAWKTSLPGALCPLDAYERLLETWAGHAEKLTVCLPLYGYDWPRPADVSLPRADTVILRDLPDMDAEFYWMQAEGELAARSRRGTPPRMAAVPSLRAVHLRVGRALDRGIPSVAFWHLGMSELAPVVQATRRDASPVESVPVRELAGWDKWLIPFKNGVCRVITGDGSSLEKIALLHGIPPTTLYRFNHHIREDTTGETIYLPKKW